MSELVYHKNLIRKRNIRKDKSMIKRKFRLEKRLTEARIAGDIEDRKAKYFHLENQELETELTFFERISLWIVKMIEKIFGKKKAVV